MNYEGALAYLEKHINLEAKAGRWEGLGLDRIRSMMNVLGDPQTAYPVIHITGTNGKGSTSLMITQLLMARGLTVGTYTSPHLERINERIRINAEPIDDAAFAEAIAEVADLEMMVDGPLSHFEVLTAAALAYFAAYAVDVAVIEVGLLGRFDATNVVDADVAVITNIGRDHTDGTGDWRAAIAAEKAGIIKPNSIVVLGETSTELRPIFYAEPHAGILERGVHFSASDNRVAIGGRAVDLRGPFGTYDDVFVAMHGPHQADNAAAALAAVEAFFGAAIEDELVREAFAAVRVPGRFEIVHRHPLIVIDDAHNPDGARAAVRTLDEDFGVAHRRILVMGLLQGRSVEDMLDALEAARCEMVIVCEADWPRRIPAEDIAAVARDKDIAVEVVRDVGEAMHRARSLAEDGDVVFVTGSNYIVGPARHIAKSLD